MSKPAQWTDAELEWLRESFPHGLNSELRREHDALFPDTPRGVQSIKVKAHKLGLRKAGAWTPDEDEWLRAEYPRHLTRDLPKAHAEAFPERQERTSGAIHQRAHKLGIRKADDLDRWPPTFWTPDKVEWLKAYVPGHTEREISAEHERLYGTPLTRGQISSAKLCFGVKSGVASTRFKKGEVANQNLLRAVGAERCSHGYVYVKTEDGWRPKHHVVYEQAHGPVPEGCIVVFADRDKANFDPENIVAVPKGLFATVSRHRLSYYDRPSLETAVNVARLISMRAGILRGEKEEK